MARIGFANRIHPVRQALTLGLLLLLLAPVAPPAPADDAHPPLRYGQGLLWRIEGHDVAPSYVFGTMHTNDPRVTALPAPVQEAFDRAGSFTMEYIVDGKGMTQMAQAMFLDDGRTLESVIGTELYMRAREAVRDHGLGDYDISRSKPWAVVTLLSAPPPAPGDGLPLDMKLQLRATMQGKPVYGLETAAEQISVLNGLSLKDQTELLRETLDDYPQAQHDFETITRAYLARDVAAILALDEKYQPENRALQDEVMKRLLSDRNARMVARLRLRLEEGNAFIAIGAAHLPGDDGVLHLLERAGYRVSRVY